MKTNHIERKLVKNNNLSFYILQYLYNGGQSKDCNVLVFLIDKITVGAYCVLYYFTKILDEFPRRLLHNDP